MTAVMATDVDSVTNSQLTYSVSDANFTVQTINNIAYIRTAQSVTLLSSSVRMIITTIIICMSSLVFYRAMLWIRGTSHGPVSVRLSQVGVLLKRQNVGSHKQRHTIPQGVWFFDAKDLREIRPGSPPYEGAECRWGGQNRRLSTNNRLYLENGTRETYSFY